MNLLFDQNISFRIVKELENTFTGCSHISNFGLLDRNDIQIWNFAKENNFCIVTFDYDFIDLSVLNGSPPKMIIIKTGNTKTDQLISILKSYEPHIKEFLIDQESSILALI